MRANRTVTLQRGEKVTTDLLDEITVPRIIETKLPAFFSKLYSRRDKYTADSQDVVGTLRVERRVQIQVGDRIVIDQDGSTYEVRGINRSGITNGELIVDLGRISGRK